MLKILFYIISILLLLGLILKFTTSPKINNNNILSPWAQQKILLETQHITSNSLQQNYIEKTYIDLSSIQGNLLLRFQIINNILYINPIDESNEKMVIASSAMINFLSKMLQKSPLNRNVDFLLVISDTLSIPDDYILSTPLIVPAKNINSKYAQSLLLAPDYKTIAEWPRLYNDIIASNNEHNWEKKLNKAFWRGTASDLESSRANWYDFGRIKLVELSKQNPQLIDARFTKMANADTETLIAEKYPLAVPVSYSEYTRYKIEINIDGNNAASYPGFLWKLLSNSVVIKQQSNYVQWFYDLLEDNKHYISCAYDLSNIQDKIIWIQNNDQEAAKIGQAGSSLIENEISPTHLYLYWHELLTKYAEFQGFTLRTPSPTFKSMK